MMEPQGKQVEPNSHRTDSLTPQQRSHAMRQVHGKNTSPELVVRRLAHKLGYRFRLHRSDLPGKPDLIFPKRRKIIFVHGCFWHRHDCRAGRKQPKSNLEYWTRKLERNRLRDIDSQTKLREIGWDVLVVWECETRDLKALEVALRSFLDAPKGDK